MRGFPHNEAITHNHFSRNASTSPADVRKPPTISNAATTTSVFSQNVAAGSAHSVRANDQNDQKEFIVDAAKNFNPGKRLLSHIPQEVWHVALANSTGGYSKETSDQTNGEESMRTSPSRRYPSAIKQQLRFLLSFRSSDCAMDTERPRE